MLTRKPTTEAVHEAQAPGLGSYLTRLTDAQCERLHEATLQVLERTGLIVDEPEALETAEQGGRRRGRRHARPHPRAAGRVGARASAPREVTLYDRDGEPALRARRRADLLRHRQRLHVLLRPPHRRAAPRGAAGRRRCGHASTDACENIDFVMSLFTPSDVDAAAMDRYQMASDARQHDQADRVHHHERRERASRRGRHGGGGGRRARRACASVRSSPATRTRCSRSCTTARPCGRCSTWPARTCRASTARSPRPAPSRR